MWKRQLSNYFICLKRFSIGLAAVALLVGCATNSKKEVIALPGVDTSLTSNTAGINPMRLQVLQDTATGFGAQAGLAWQARNINNTLKQDENRLNQVFNFNGLLLKDNVLPPVLTEGQNDLNLSDDNTIRLAEQIYKIEQPPRFVTAAPTWRDYLWMNFSSPQAPSSSLLPKNPQERKVWNEYIKQGWQQGIDQANQIFSANVGRLKRDYAGMILYRKLLTQNMVTPPYVSKLNLGVTGDANSLRINDQVLRIAAVSEMNTNAKTWRPVIIKNNDSP